MDKQTLQQHLQNTTDIVLIDVRSKDEFEERHIPNTIHIPIEMIE
ncbi:MAG: rhodanese-like domain-containing protein, partial [Sphingobacteriaceae bacterium]